LDCLFTGAKIQVEAWRVIAAENGGCEDAGDPPRGKGPKNK